MTGNAGGTKLTAGTAGATGIFFSWKEKKQATSILRVFSGITILSTDLTAIYVKHQMYRSLRTYILNTVKY